MSSIFAIFRKQCKDTLKNKTILIQFVMFPALTVIMNYAVNTDGLPENFFIHLFATMYTGMAPLTAMAAVISEEKEKNTLRVLMMSDVKPFEYLLGIGGQIWLVCMLGAAVICSAGSYDLRDSAVFMGIMATGIFVSLLAGAAIGTFSRTQMMATSVTLPVMLVLSFAPMLSYFNAAVAKAAKFLYTEQIAVMLRQAGSIKPDAENICVIACNILAAAALFTITYRRGRLA